MPFFLFFNTSVFSPPVMPRFLQLLKFGFESDIDNLILSNTAISSRYQFHKKSSDICLWQHFRDRCILRQSQAVLKHTATTLTFKLQAKNHQLLCYSSSTYPWSELPLVAHYIVLYTPMSSRDHPVLTHDLNSLWWHITLYYTLPWVPGTIQYLPMIWTPSGGTLHCTLHSHEFQGPSKYWQAAQLTTVPTSDSETISSFTTSNNNIATRFIRITIMLIENIIWTILSRNSFYKNKTQNTRIVYWTVLTPQLRWQFHHWHMLCILALYIVNVHRCRNSDGFLTFLTFWIMFVNSASYWYH